MSLLWVAILLATVLTGMWLWKVTRRSLAKGSEDKWQTVLTDRLEYRMKAFRNERVMDAMQLEFEREDRVARENFERRHAKYREVYCAEGQFRR